jgi:hypothetical protein
VGRGDDAPNSDAGRSPVDFIYTMSYKIATKICTASMVVYIKASGTKINCVNLVPFWGSRVLELLMAVIP